MENFWDRIVLKERAKTVLKKSYWQSFLSNMVIGAISGAVSSILTTIVWIFLSFIILLTLMPLGRLSDIESLREAFFSDGAGWLMFIIGYLVFLVFFVIVSYIIAVATEVFNIGLKKFYIKSSCGDDNLSNMFDFRSFGNKIKVTFVTNILILLWSLLFTIPGIIAAYRYWMVPYILAENPDMTWKRALEISEQTTNGEKGKMFVLTLSFLGWSLLGALACGIGVMFVAPYINATHAELYCALKYKAISTNIATESEFCGTVITE